MTTRHVWMAVAALVVGLVGVGLWVATDDDASSSTVDDYEPGSDLDPPAAVVTPPEGDTAVPGSGVTTLPLPDATTVPVPDESLPPETPAPTAPPETPAPTAPPETPAPTAPPETPAPTTPPETAPTITLAPAVLDTSTWPRCINPFFGWEVGYPTNWTVYSDPEGSDDCSAFSPYDLAGLDVASAFASSEIFIGLLGGDDLDSFAAAYIHPEDFESPPIVESITIAGRSALRYTGVRPPDDDSEITWGTKEYVVDMTDLATPGVLYLMASAPYETRFAETVDVLDAMATTLTIVAG